MSAETDSNIAVVARKFHQLGYNHRDLYCCHFIREDAPASSRSMIDLQRIEHGDGGDAGW